MLAYLILVHRFPDQFKRMFKAIFDPENIYVIHIDKKSAPDITRDIQEFLAAYPNTSILPSKSAIWGGYSLVDAELRGMAQLLEMSSKWDYFINLSGQDFPLKSQGYIADFLAKNKGSEFIKAVDQERFRPDTMLRIQQVAFELGDRVFRTFFKRKFLTDARPYIGNQWMIVSRTFCQYVCHDRSVARYKAFYRNTFIADEGFFQTVLMNSALRCRLVNDDLRMIDWVPDGDIKLRPRTFTTADADSLTTSVNLFARKFDASLDDSIFDTLEESIGTPDVHRRSMEDPGSTVMPLAMAG